MNESAALSSSPASRSSAGEDVFGPGPTRTQSIVDIVIYIVAGFVFYGIEEWLRAIDKFPYPGLFDGAFALIAAFFVGIFLMKWRGQTIAAFGLRRPRRRWWFVPLWGLAIFAANVVAQLTIVPLLAQLFKLPPVDLSRYDIMAGNLKLFLIATPGAMITGGFMEEVIYRGMMIDRIGRIFGGDRRALWIGAALCGVPFGLIHFEWGIGGMFTTAVMGSLLGLFYIGTKRNLWPLIAAHATLDFLLMLQVYLGMTQAN